MDKLYITTLGEFTMTYGDVTISEQTKRSKKLWPLIQYLVTFHDVGVSQTELIELLWGDEESDNPVGALKTQMHRLRAILAELDCVQPIVISVNGSYAFNTDIPYEIDSETFEALFKEAQTAGNSKERLRLLLEAINLYSGDFLRKLSFESWVVPINTYYRSVFSKAAHMAIEILIAENRPHDIATVCKKAAAIDPYDEYLHYNLIKVLAELGDQQNAKKHYEYVKELLYSKFGVSPSQELMELYESTVKTKKNIEMDLDVVEKSLLETQRVTGAFLCEYQVFKHLYQLELREAQRSGKTVSVCLASISTPKGELPMQKPLNRAMLRLSDCIGSSLRGSDVFTRYSVSQFIIMLPQTNEQNCSMVLKRIEKNFRHENTSKDIELTCRFKIAAPSEEINEK